MDPHHHPGYLKGIHLSLGQKVAGIHQGKSQNLSLELICRRASQHHKGIVVMAGSASRASHRLNSLFKPPGPHMTLSSPRAGKLDPLIFVVRQVKTKAHGPCDLALLIPFVFKPRVSRYGVFLLENGIAQGHLHLQKLIPQQDL